MPANDAKRLLFEFSEKHRSKVSSTYLIAGWTKGAVPQHSVQLIDASDVADKRSKLDPVTSLHVYSIRPSAPKASPGCLLSYHCKQCLFQLSQQETNTSAISLQKDFLVVMKMHS